ncbi:preprotein translocase subunit YajC [Corynebacterium freiburgense]|uniref:preprotein translocase subunit YajC n=1 Tax=Corynebacterium freiburgense TaxID=556548 RepID=UPI0003FE998C|nr:preprotein translocase subunit YajC [Corynebacterium freiburgense]WJZ02823.1 preprotein translocase subunit YajC [Corynebacterium freiburgense]
MSQYLLLALLLVVFLVPSLLQLRRQQRLLAERRALQASVQTGDRVVTAAGVHGVVVTVREQEVDLELAPDVVTTWDLAAIVRRREGDVDKP